MEQNNGSKRKLLIKNARMIDPSTDVDRVGDLLIENGKIVEVGEGLCTAGVTVLDASGLVAAPGLVDMHVHLRDPGFTEKEDILTGCAAALAGGVTTLAAMPNTHPVTDDPEVVRYILEKAQETGVKVLPVAAVTKNIGGEKLTDFKALKEAGAVGFSDDGKPVGSVVLMQKALQEAEFYNMPVLAHCEEPQLAGFGIVNEGTVSKMLGLPGSPVSAETVGIARELALAASTGCRVHICHVSTALSVEMIRAAKANGVKVTAETCPHYFALNEENLLLQDADYRMNPPLRTDIDRRAIIRGIMDGTIDAIATDHAPHTPEEKARFESAPNGMIGLETSLAVSNTYLVAGGYINLFKLLYMMSTVPARILGVKAGTLKPGYAADIVLFDPNEKWVVDENKMKSKSKNTAFKGMTLTGKVKYTIAGGEVRYQDDSGEEETCHSND